MKRKIYLIFILPIIIIFASCSNTYVTSDSSQDDYIKIYYGLDSYSSNSIVDGISGYRINYLPTNKLLSDDNYFGIEKNNQMAVLNENEIGIIIQTDYEEDIIGIEIETKGNIIINEIDCSNTKKSLNVEKTLLQTSDYEFYAIYLNVKIEDIANLKILSVYSNTKKVDIENPEISKLSLIYLPSLINNVECINDSYSFNIIDDNIRIDKVKSDGAVIEPQNGVYTSSDLVDIDYRYIYNDVEIKCSRSIYFN